MLESKLILFTYRKYLEANAAGFQAIYSELISSFERKTRRKELFSPLFEASECWRGASVFVLGGLTNIRITNIK